MYELNQMNLYRVVTIGESGVGKTSIIKRIISNEFNLDESPTYGASFFVHRASLGGSVIDVQIWDTAGQEKFKSLAPIYFRNASAAIVVFDVSSKDSFKAVPDWIRLFTDSVGTGSIIYVCANKTDLPHEEELLEEAREWAKNEGYKYYEVSASMNIGIGDLIAELMNDLYRSNKKKVASTNDAKIEPKRSSSGCC